jgi:hypothetical protein
MEKMYFNGKNFSQIKEFAGDACEIEPVYDNNGVVWGQRAYIKTTDGRRIELMSDDVVIKDVNGIHVLGE